MVTYIVNVFIWLLVLCLVLEPFGSCLGFVVSEPVSSSPCFLHGLLLTGVFDEA